MNTVLTLMYAADLASGIAVIASLVAVVMLIVWLVRWMIVATDTFGEGAAMRSMPDRRVLWAATALFVLAAVMPSKTTLYAAAAIQAGDILADTERGQKVLHALDAWLERQANGSGDE